jgi:hypothetical protein
VVIKHPPPPPELAVLLALPEFSAAGLGLTMADWMLSSPSASTEVTA